MKPLIDALWNFLTCKIERTSSRVLSSGIASAGILGLNILGRILLVPVFLSFWDADTYGYWLLIEAIMGFVLVLDLSHQTFLGSEFLRLQLRKKVLNRMVWTGLWGSVSVGVLEMIALVVAMQTGLLREIIQPDAGHEGVFGQMQVVLFLYCLNFAVFMSSGGIFTRFYAAIGYQANITWIGFVNAIVTFIFPILPVPFGGNLLHAGISGFIGQLLLNLYATAIYFSLLKKEGFTPVRPAMRVMVRNYFKSLYILVTNIISRFKLTGFRLVLVPIVGISGMSLFSVTRTVPNTLQLVMASIFVPLVPEMMRFFNSRDRDRFEASFGLMWIVILGTLVPGMFAFQVFIEPIFKVWVQGKFELDYELLSVLSAGTILFSMGVPHASLLRSNNLLKEELMLSILSFGVLTAGVLGLTGPFGLVGAAYAILISEGVNSAATLYVANRWLGQQGFPLSRKPNRWAIVNCVQGTLVLLVVGTFAQNSLSRLLLSLFGLAMTLTLVVFYWHSLGKNVNSHLSASVIQRIQPLKKKLKFLP